jgi:hypothetical protein
MELSPEKIIETICPELSGSPSLQVYLGMAVDVTSRDFFGAVYNQAVAYTAAHLFTMFEGGSSGTVDSIQQLGGGAPISSMSEGGISVSFAQSAASESDLGNKKKKKMLIALKKGRPKMGVNQFGG